MATSIISAGDAANLGVQTTGGDDGVLVLRSGAAGAKVDALSIAAVGTGAFVGEVTATGFTGTLDGVLGGGTPAAANVTTLAASGDLSANNFAGKNRIINPSGVINQRGAVTALGTQNFVDRWFTHKSSGSVANGNTVSGYIELDFTTADTSIGVNDYFLLAQKIEGFNSASLLIGTASAKTITISFKHKHTKTGVNSVALRNSANNRFYVFNYTQSVSNTEETHSETITLDTTGTWIGATNGMGLELLFTVIIGSNFQGTAGAWTATAIFSTSSQVNNGDAVGNKFRITDVQLEEGTVATEFEYRPYGTELALCQRYFEKVAYTIAAQDIMVGMCGQNVNNVGVYQFQVTKRANPTGAYSALTDFLCFRQNYSNDAPSALGLVSSTRDCAINPTIASTNFTPGFASLFRLTGTSGFLSFNAEL